MSRPAGRRRRDHGASAVFFAILAVPMLLLFGLVVDGGRAIADRQRAGDVALEAARQIVSQCDQNAIYTNGGICEVAVADTSRLCAGAERYVSSYGIGTDGDHGVSYAIERPSDCQLKQGDGQHARAAEVRVCAKASTYILQMAGLGSIHQCATETAEAVTAVG
ncbi:MAG: TadE/TadG family type IV pilus assembly protein [Mycobacteriales bacterium]